MWWLLLRLPLPRPRLVFLHNLMLRFLLQLLRPSRLSSALLVLLQNRLIVSVAFRCTKIFGTPGDRPPIGETPGPGELSASFPIATMLFSRLFWP